MSWKLFGQIVLLIIIVALVMSTVRIGKHCLYKKYKGKISAHSTQK